jgi:hypothetical protein
MAWLYIRSRSIWVPTFTHAFADVLLGFSSLLFPAKEEIHFWAVLQVAQLILSIVLLMDLRSRLGVDKRGAEEKGAQLIHYELSNSNM